MKLGMRHARAAGVAALAAMIASCGGGGDGITVTPTPCTPVDLTYPGSANGTIASNGCTSGGFRAALYRFTANPANAHTFTATSSFSALGVEVMSDPPGTNVVWVSTVSAVNADWLLPAGSYLLRVTARTNGASGTFALTGSNSPLNTTDCTVRTLVVGVTLVDHALAATDCPYLPADGTYFDAYGIQSAKPCTIRMSSATMDSYLEVRNSTQANILASNDDDPMGGGSEDSFLSLAACSNNNGPIVIRANTFDNAVPTGNYTLTVTITGGGSVVAAGNFAVPMFADEPVVQSLVSAGASKPKTKR